MDQTDRHQRTDTYNYSFFTSPSPSPTPRPRCYESSSPPPFPPDFSPAINRKAPQTFRDADRFRRETEASFLHYPVTTRYPNNSCDSAGREYRRSQVNALESSLGYLVPQISRSLRLAVCHHRFLATLPAGICGQREKRQLWHTRISRLLPRSRHPGAILRPPAVSRARGCSRLSSAPLPPPPPPPSPSLSLPPPPPSPSPSPLPPPRRTAGAGGKRRRRPCGYQTRAWRTTKEDAQLRPRTKWGRSKRSFGAHGKRNTF